MKNPPSALQRLESIGFRQCGAWALIGAAQIKMVFTDHAQSSNALYAFVSGGEVLYVGKTTQSLRQRLYGYQNPRTTQTTNVRGHEPVRNFVCEA